MDYVIKSINTKNKTAYSENYNLYNKGNGVFVAFIDYLSWPDGFLLFPRGRDGCQMKLCIVLCVWVSCGLGK